MLAVLVCLGVGFAGARQMSGTPSRESHAARAMQAQPQATEAISAAVPQSAAAAEWSEALAKYKSGNLADAHAVMAAILRMEAADFPASAEKLLEGFGKNPGYDPASAALADAWLGRWLEIDSPGALRFLEAMQVFAKLSDVNDWYVPTNGAGGLLAALSRKEPEWVKQFIENQPEGNLRSSAIWALVSELTRTDADAGRRYVDSLPEGAGRNLGTNLYLNQLSQIAPSAALDFAMNSQPQSLRNERLRSVFSYSASRNLPTTMALLDRITNPAERRQYAMAALTSAWERGAELLPYLKDEVARSAAELGEKADFGKLANTAQNAARGQDRKSFVEWAFELSADKRGSILSAVAGRWAYESPKEFAAWASAQAATANPDQLAKLNTAMTSALIYPAAQKALAEALPPGSLRDQAHFKVSLAAAAEGDAAKAVEAYRTVAATDKNGALASQLARALVMKNPAAAAEWATAQPAGIARDAALRVVAENWSLRDVHGAAQWATSLPAGLERDRAMSTYATTVVVADAPAAAEWVGQVADPKLREKAATTVFKRWHIQDPAAARAWLHTQSPALAQKIWRTIE